MPAPARTGGGSRLPMRDLIRMAAKIHSLPCGVRRAHRTAAVPGPPETRRHRRPATDLLRPRPRLHPSQLPRIRLSLRGSPFTALGARRVHRCGQAVLRVRPNHGSESRGELHTEVTKSGRLGWTDGTGPTRNQPRPPPRRTPPRRLGPARPPQASRAQFRRRHRSHHPYTRRYPRGSARLEGGRGYRPAWRRARSPLHARHRGKQSGALRCSPPSRSVNRVPESIGLNVTMPFSRTRGCSGDHIAVARHIDTRRVGDPHRQRPQRNSAPDRLLEPSAVWWCSSTCTDTTSGCKSLMLSRST